MKKTNLKEKLQNWKLGNYFRELSIVTAGVFITLAGTDFINSASQEKQINKSMQMIKMELEENLKSINQAEAAYLNEINFFRLLIQKQDSLQTIKASILENNANAPFAYENCEYSEDALEVLKSSALMQQIPDKEFILKLLQAYKGCRKINEDNKAENNKDLIYIIQSRQAAFRLPVILLFIFNISLYRGQGYFSPFNYRS